MKHNDWFWRSEDDTQVLAAFIAQHGLVSGMQDDTFVVGFHGDVPDPFTSYVCGLCGTAVSRHGDAGWRHDVAWRDRGGCMTAQPREVRETTL